MGGFDWSQHDIVALCGGLLEKDKAHSGDEGLIHTLHDVVEANTVALSCARPELNLDGVEVLVTGGEHRGTFAIQHGNKRAIVIDIGLLRWFWERAAVAMHLSDFLPDFLPHRAAPDISWFDPKHPVVPAFDLWKIADERKSYCISLFQHMLDYLVLHEFAHHMRGHLRLVSHGHEFAALGEVEIRNLRWDSDQQNEAFNVQDLELDADAHALDLALAVMLSKFPQSKFKWNIDSVSEELFQMITAQILVAQLFDDIGKELTDHSLSKHPAPQYRSINFSNLAARNMHGIVGGNWDDFKRIHDMAWTETGKVAEFFAFPFGRWYGDEVLKLLTHHYHSVEARYFSVTERIDRLIDLESLDKAVANYRAASRSLSPTWDANNRPKPDIATSTVSKITNQSLEVLGFEPDVRKFLGHIAPEADVDQLSFTETLELLAKSLRDDVLQCLDDDQAKLFESSHLKFLDTGLANACCVKTDVNGRSLGFYIIFLNEGLYFALRQLFTALLYEELQGDLAEFKRDGTQAFEFAVKLYLDPRHENIKPVTENVGDIQASGEIGAHITSATSLLLQFVVLHEFAHAWLGHHDLLNSQSLSLGASPEKLKNSSHDRANHKLEFDADEFAFRALVARTKSIDAQWAHCFALHLFFSYLSELEVKSAKPLSYFHPKPMERAQKLRQILKEEFPSEAHRESVLERIDELVAKWTSKA